MQKYRSNRHSLRLVETLTGKLTVHPREFNCEDDDMLDDLPQRVIAKEGEAIVTSHSEIPDGNLAWAILDIPRNRPSQFLKIEAKTSWNNL